MAVGVLKIIIIADQAWVKEFLSWANILKKLCNYKVDAYQFTFIYLINETVS
ncbi:hypothetical protein GCM10027341_53560 [Spirosoma knui]